MIELPDRSCRPSSRDPANIEQVVMNLGGQRARRHAEGRQITITTARRCRSMPRCREQNPEAHEGHFVCLSVSG